MRRKKFRHRIGQLRPGAGPLGQAGPGGPHITRGRPGKMTPRATRVVLSLIFLYHLNSEIVARSGRVAAGPAELGAIGLPLAKSFWVQVLCRGGRVTPTGPFPPTADGDLLGMSWLVSPPSPTDRGLAGDYRLLSLSPASVRLSKGHLQHLRACRSPHQHIDSSIP